MYLLVIETERLQAAIGEAGDVGGETGQAHVAVFHLQTEILPQHRQSRSFDGMAGKAGNSAATIESMFDLDIRKSI